MKLWCRMQNIDLRLHAFKMKNLKDMLSVRRIDKMKNEDVMKLNERINENIYYVDLVKWKG